MGKWTSCQNGAETSSFYAPAVLRLTIMRENSRFEMMRAVGAKAVASVEMAVPPTMVAGERVAKLLWFHV